VEIDRRIGALNDFKKVKKRGSTKAESSQYFTNKTPETIVMNFVLASGIRIVITCGKFSISWSWGFSWLTPESDLSRWKFTLPIQHCKALARWNLNKS
jgi:hypothetical protein